MIALFYGCAFALAGFFAWCTTLQFGGAMELGTHSFVVRALQFVFSAIAVWILWVVRPRSGTFRAPGPELDKLRQPQVFDEVESVARSMSQPMPDEIWLAPDVNASIGQRGGFFGIGTRRFLILGLPLLRGLTRAQLRAVLAHEFGHACAGDLRMGPWIHKARNAMLATLRAIGGQNQQDFGHALFGGYTRLFLRVTQSVSRHQEFVADEFAARNEGPKNLIAGLRTITSIDPAFQAYWQSECIPVLQSGFLPPIAAGFDQFLRSEQIARQVQEGLAWQLRATEGDPYDSHPLLSERVAAIEEVHSGMESMGNEPAIRLLEDLPELERDLIVRMAGKEAADKLAVVAWAEVGRRVWLPNWQKLAQANAKVLCDVEPGSLPGLSTSLMRFKTRCVWTGGRVTDSDAQTTLALAVLGAGLAVLLVGRGGSVEALPGKAIRVRVGSIVVEPFDVVPRLAKGELSEAAWREQCEQLGIGGRRFSQVALAAA